MQQHPYSVLPLVQFKGQLIFTPCPGTKGTRSFEALQTLKDAGASALLTLMPTEEFTLKMSRIGVRLPEDDLFAGVR